MKCATPVIGVNMNTDMAGKKPFKNWLYEEKKSRIPQLIQHVKFNSKYPEAIQQQWWHGCQHFVLGPLDVHLQH